MTQEALVNEKAIQDSSGIPCGSLSKQKAIRDQEREDKQFPFVNLIKKSPETWEQLQEFYGLDDAFPIDFLYYLQEAESGRKIVLLNFDLHFMMQSTKKKYKLNCVNLGLKLFQRNR